MRTPGQAEHLTKSQLYILPLKLGHRTDQDNHFGPKGVHIRQVPLYCFGKPIHLHTVPQVRI